MELTLLETWKPEVDTPRLVTRWASGNAVDDPKGNSSLGGRSPSFITLSNKFPATVPFRLPVVRRLPRA
jgi:hypothetical protein